jgi:uncharacterized damage-inducible protein DinB
MPDCDDVVLLARYNAVMNGKLYAAAATLDDAALRRERGAFFGSLLGTMNHLVAGDTVWLTRFASHPAQFAALAPLRGTAPPSSLTQSFGDDLAALQARRTRLDAMIEAFAAELRPADLAQPLDYRNMKGQPFRKPFGGLLLHFFNHQTHHRGQASTLLFQAGVDIGVTDLLVLIDDAGA